MLNLITDFLNNLSSSLSLYKTIIHCERLTFLIYEPLNTLSNLAFLVSGYYSSKLIKNKNVNFKIKLLPYSISLIGIGSFLFHYFRNTLTNYLDTIPIFIFVLLMLLIILEKLLKNKSLAYGITIIFITIQTFIYLNYLNLTNGSLNYIGIIITFFILAILLFIKKKGEGKSIFLSILVFSLALFFRQLDILICSYFNFGTHFLWHILTAVSAYMAVVFVIKLKKVYKSQSP
jgi:hypothetical protein